MAAKRIYSLVFLSMFMLSLVAAVVKAERGPVEDAYWKGREAEAEKVAAASVDPHPEKVTEELNTNVGELLAEQNQKPEN